MTELAIVMPVYNEEACIASVVGEWLAVIESLSIDFQLIILNDGSTDATMERLEDFCDNRSIILVDKANEGHGPTILRGYRTAVDVAEWVFQTDSDRETPASAFPAFWRAREGFDFIFGYREGRVQGPARRIISRGAGLVVRLFGGRGVPDANVPYRLMRGGCLRELLGLIPRDTFAPNVAISGLATTRKFRITSRPVPYRARRTGSTSLTQWRIWRAAVKSFFQTLCILVKSRNPR